MVSFKYSPGPDKEADTFKKNFNAGLLHRHSIDLCGNDGLLAIQEGKNLEAGEVVGSLHLLVVLLNQLNIFKYE